MKNIVFFGSDNYSAIVLTALLEAKNLNLKAIVTTPQKPQGRGRELLPNAVENLAATHKIKVLYYPPNIDDLSKLIDKDTLGVSASFGRIISSEILRLFPHGIYNLHPSLLPQYRNVAPAPYAIAMGDLITGITIFQMDEKIDNGKNLIQIEEKILPTDTSPILLKRLFSKGADSLVNWLNKPTLPPAHHSEAQKSEGWIFTRKLTRATGFIEWSLFQKYLNHEIISLEDTANPLITLRLTHHPARNQGYAVISDLSRALAGWERLWTKAPGKNGEIEVYLTSLDPIMIQIPGKPKSISYQDFLKYYL